VSDKEDLGLAEGGRYSVTAEKDTVSEGTFIGYAMLGSESAIVLRLKGGTVRMIPIAKIIQIDLLGSADRRKEEKRQESAYY